MSFLIRPLTSSDQTLVTQFIIEHWGSEIVVAHDTIYHPAELQGFAAIRDNTIIGLATYHIAKDECEIVTLDSVQKKTGIGTALIDAVKNIAIESKCKRLWLITTNDNLNALLFYQKRGFVLVAIHREAVTRARKLKPQIPLIGEFGIPLRDEVELEIKV